ncbi:MAG TPA: hypothetical protein VEJ84_20235 [Acidimicrobiales bacterium]|nr:hypothetical protein [Acidimicrobiales bacterium]
MTLHARLLTRGLPVLAAGGLLAGSAAMVAPISAAATEVPAASSSGLGNGTPGSYTTNLKGVCPSNVIIQTDWWPEPDHGGLYELIPPGAGKANINANSYSGPLGHTGVEVTLLAGGPAVGYQNVTSQLYVNPNIYLGQVQTDESIQLSATQPTTAVFASYEKSPQIFFWGNPKWNFKTVKQIGQSGVTVLAYQATYLDVFESEGLLTSKQVDTSYQGNPSRFVAAGGNIVSQGFIDDEPYIYAHEVQGWDKAVHYITVANEYPVYTNSLVVRSAALKSDSACLTKLVPILQQAEIDYVHNPAEVNQVIYNFASSLKGGSQLNIPGSVAAVKILVSSGIIANGTDGVFGSFNTTRLQKLIATLKPIFASQQKPIKAGLQPSDIATNQFLDPNIHL